MGRNLLGKVAAIGTAVVLSFPLAAFGWLDKTNPAVVEVLDSEDTQFYYYAGPGQQSEWELSGGARSQTRIKGHQDLTALKFDLSAYLGKTVVAAELHLARGDTNPVFSLAASTFNTDWSEGAGNAERTVGAPCYRWRVTPASSSIFTLDNEWTFSRSDVSTAALGNFGSLTCFGFNASDTFKTYIDGTRTWIAMKLDPAVVQSLMVDQYGLMVTDARMHAGTYNPTVYTKDQNSSVQPRLLIQFAEDLDTTPPAAIAALAAVAGPENGQVVLQFNAPTDPQAAKAFGYTIRYGQVDDFAVAADLARWRIPRPKVPGAPQRALLEGLTPGATYYFFVQAYDAVGNAAAPTSTSFTVPAAAAVPVLADGSFVTPNATGKTVRTVGSTLRYWATPEITKVNPVTGNRMEDGYTSATQYDNHKKANAVWDSATNTISLLACRNEVVGAQLLIERLGANLTNVSVTASDLTRVGGGTIPAAQCVEFFQVHYVVSGSTWYPEPAIPLAAPFATTFNIPDTSRNPSGKNQAVWMDVYVPKDVPAGDYTGTITINATQLTSPVTLNLAIRASRIEIPDQPTFLVDLNGYGNPWNWNGYSQTQVDRICLRYFQVSHKHRAVTNTLPYGWTGNFQADRTPTLTGSGSTLHADDWSTMDRRYGPLFDGSAFSPNNALSPYYGPGMNTPVTHFYSTFFESWPIRILDATYGFDALGLGGQYWYDLKLSNINAMFANLPDAWVAFTDGYKQGLRNVMADWVQHAKSKGWTKTAFQTYHNHKYSYTGAEVFWVMEENETADDFRSLGFWQQLWREGQALADANDVKWHFRIDISDRWGQHYGELDNRINFWMMGSGAAGWHWPHMKYRNYLLDADKQEEWNWYGGGTSPTAQGTSHSRLFLQRWSQGFDGGIPYWNNYGNSWSSPDELSTVYRGDSVPGQATAYEGAILSIRVKQMRQAEQLVELLNLWAGADGMNRQRVRDSVFAKYGTTSSWDYSFGSVDENKLYRMRADLIAHLEKVTGDINGDGVVDMADILLLVEAFGTVSGDPLYNAACDFNTDGMVDVVDLLILVYNWPH